MMRMQTIMGNMIIGKKNTNTQKTVKPTMTAVVLSNAILSGVIMVTLCDVAQRTISLPGSLPSLIIFIVVV